MPTPDLSPELSSKLLILPTSPGVYIFYGAGRKCLYIGKAINLKNRVKSYFNKNLSPRLTMMRAEITDLEITTTSSSAAALVLENNLIKEAKPRYNILFRDDKTYPYIKITQHPYPRLMFYRGPRQAQEDYFGPFPDSSAVRRSIDLLQKIFKVRSCTDAVFRARTKPCLLYSIKRCSAPCVNYISQPDYLQDVKAIRDLLGGKKQDLENDLRTQMESAAAALDFESAAKYRDHIKYLAVLKNQHHVDEKNLTNTDYLGIHLTPSAACINLVSIRNGIRLGETRFFTQPRGADASEILTAFVDYYYAPDNKIRIITAEPVVSNFAVPHLGGPTSQDHQFRLREANQNAKLALELRSTSYKKLTQLASELKIKNLKRLECFDISHSGGSEPVASRVVFINGEKAPAHYRRYGITPTHGGDDPKSIAEAVRRCYTRAVREGAELPDLIIIDGGVTQLNAAVAALPSALAETAIIGFAKGAARTSGAEKIILRSGAEFPLSPFSGAFHLLQEIRDEAHRFALFGHRVKRGKKSIKSVLDDIEGLGPKKKKELIATLGGVAQIREAGLKQLSQVHGISPALAQRIYEHLH